MLHNSDTCNVLLACRLNAGISGSERTYVARQRLGSHGSFAFAGESTKHVHAATHT
jgi:hypothetical protein